MSKREKQWTSNRRAIEMTREYFPNCTKEELAEVLYAANRGERPTRDGEHFAPESVIRARLESTRALFCRAFGVKE